MLPNIRSHGNGAEKLLIFAIRQRQPATGADHLDMKSRSTTVPGIAPCVRAARSIVSSV